MPKMKDIPRIERPRERLAKYGPEKLRDEELLALVLGAGTKGLNVLQLSRRILKRIHIVGREKITLDILLEERGLGKAKAAQILALLALGQRLGSEDQSEILSSEDIWRRCEDIRESKREHFLAFYLDTQGRVIERRVISIGTLNASLVHPREVFEPAVVLHAASIVVAHNHPSGDVNPSATDIALTKRLIESGKILGISIDDHIIVSKKTYTSLKNHL